MQAVMKGYYVRKWLIPKKKQILKLINAYVDRLIRNFVEDKMIPDIVLEIIHYNKFNEDVSLYSTEYRAYLEVMDKILMRVVKD